MRSRVEMVCSTFAGSGVPLLVLLLALCTTLAAPAPAAAAARAAAAGARAAKPERCPDRQVRVRSGRAIQISVRCRGLGGLRIRWALRPRHGTVGAINQRRKRVSYRPEAGYAGRDRFVVVRKRRHRRWRTVVTVRVLAPDVEPPPIQPPPLPPPTPPVQPPASPTPPAAQPAPPTQPPPPSTPGPPTGVNACSSDTVTAHYEHPVTVTVTCIGTKLGPLRVATEPASGTLTNVEEEGTASRRTLTATYTPGALFVGDDSIAVETAADSRSGVGIVRIAVLPWRMRVIGDSVTAGFGYYGNGDLMPVSDLLDCKPAAVVSNRCSSNSKAGPGYTGPPTWSPDFGLANNVSWAAQFANTWQGGGHITAPTMFQNRAVTGSAPSDWLPGGILSSQLQAIVAEDPELVAMTLGANPLLSDLLLTTEGESCSLTFTVAGLRSCVQPFFDHVDLRGRLQQVYTALLKAPDTRVVAFQYQLSIPALNLFSTWQLEAMIGLFNENIAQAVAATKAALPASQADRLFLITAQVDPSKPSATELPRFNTGLPPSIHDSWTGSYDCGGFFDSDGPSHQSDLTQDFFTAEDYDFCSGTPWIIDADSGIHPNRDGYMQFATALTNVAKANDLIPPLP